MEVEPSPDSPIALIIITNQVGLFASPPYPGSPIDMVLNCVLALLADCPSTPVVVQTSSLVPIVPAFDLNPNLFNPFIHFSHPNNPTKLHILSLDSSQTNTSSYLEITKFKLPKPPLVPLPPTFKLPPDPNTFTLITYIPTNKPVNLFEGSLMPMEETQSKSQ